MEKLSINTPQNVNIDYPLASAGSRMLAIGIDYVFMIIYGYAIFYFLMKYSTELGLNDNWAFSGAIMFLLLPVLLYHFWMETLFHGQTFGMKLMKLKVMKVDGSRAGIYEYFIRWVFNLVDIWLLSGIIGLVSIIVTDKSQRLGDIAAGTTIISLKPKMELIQTIFSPITDDYQVIYPQVVHLSDKDINEIKRIFDLSIARNDINILNKLVKRLKLVMNLEKINQSNAEFIRTIIKDHYHTFKE